MTRTKPRASKRERGRTAVQRKRSFILPLSLIALVVLALLGLYAAFGERDATEAAHDPATGASGTQHSDTPVSIPHLHGLSYGADGRELFVPAHTGLRVYADGSWHAPAVPAHDYMGYAGTDFGFYSSGHPAPGTSLVNPLGLVKSMDGGRTLTPLGFAGESDFHLMAVGYRNHAIYVANPAPNSKLQAGLYRSLDDGKSWQKSAMQGVTAQPTAMAVHPTDTGVVALATEMGLLLSRDHGNTFLPVGATDPVSAVAFSADGTRLLYGSTTLAAYDLQSKQVVAIQAPMLANEDAFAYIAPNPVRGDELAVATFGRHIYIQTGSDRGWRQIAEAGVGK